jgi:hypothetical protein
MEENIQCGDFIFFNNFDSANLAKVEKVESNKADNGKILHFLYQIIIAF